MDRKRIIQTGALFVVSILIVIWGYNYLKNNNLFSSDQVFFGVYDNINGLAAGNSVYINGYKIGMVKDVKIKENSLNKIIVQFTVNNDLKLPKSAVAEIADLDIMGTKAIQIKTKGEISDDFLVSGDTMITALQDDLKAQVNAQIMPIKAKAEELMSSFDSVLVVVQAVFNDKTRTNLKTSFEHINVALKNLKHTSFALDTIISSPDSKFNQILVNADSIAENINKNNAKIQAIVDNFKAISDSIAAGNITQILNNAETSISQFNEVMAKINAGEGTAGKLIYDDSLYYNLQNSSKKLDELLIDIEDNPKKYVHFSIIDLSPDKKKKK